MSRVVLDSTQDDVSSCMNLVPAYKALIVSQGEGETYTQELQTEFAIF
jgi:hypothetical protein